MIEPNTDVGIAIFVKTPGVSPLKTRLAATESVEYAENWYHRAAAAVAEVAQLSGATVYWAVAEADGLDAAIWQDLPRVAQVEGLESMQNASLGARMHCVHQQLLARHCAAILLGADTPQLDINVVREIVNYLQASTPRSAIAPASDGGFWLYGANSCAPRIAWESVRYSSSDTAVQFELAMRHQGKLTRFQSETDVDTAADLAVCMDALSKLPQPTTKQRALLAWMQQHAANKAF